MFIDDGTEPTDTDTTTTDTDDTDTTTDTTDTGTDDLTVEIDGESYEVDENYDFDGDGQNDAAVVQTDDGYLAMYDTDSDGVADTAVTLDEEGNVTGAAEFDESSGEWVGADPGSVENPSGDGADGSAGSTTDDSTDTTGTDTQTSDTSGESMVVEGPEGESLDVGPAQYDTDGDGQADSSVVTDADGTTYVFTDTDHDGDADQAVVVESDGDVTAVAEPADDGNWEVVETGHLDEQGNYTPDSASSTDSVWANS